MGHGYTLCTCTDPIVKGSAADRREDKPFTCDLHWFFSYAAGDLGGLHSCNLQPEGSGHTNSDPMPKDHQCKHARKWRLVHGALLAIPPDQRAVLALVFSHAPDDHAGVYGELHALVRYTEAAQLKARKLGKSVDQALRIAAKDVAFVTDVKLEARHTVTAAMTAYRAARGAPYREPHAKPYRDRHLTDIARGKALS